VLDALQTGSAVVHQPGSASHHVKPPPGLKSRKRRKKRRPTPA
jgi:hypothetical protein